MREYEDHTKRELYEEYQDAKESGPVERIDAVQTEICERWEVQFE